MIHIVQPAIPKYRIPFFYSICEKYEVKFYSTKIDFLGVKSVTSELPVMESDGFISIFKRVFWHKKLPFFKVFHKGDIVIISGNPRVLNYMLLFMVLKIRGVSTVWWGHGWSAGSFGYLAQFRIFLMRCLSSYQLFYTDREKDLLGLKNTYALNNGLEQSLFKDAVATLPVVKKSIPGNGDIQLLFIGRLTDKSNFGLLLNALSKCPNNINLNVIGDSSSINRYNRLAHDLGIHERIRWHGALFDEIEIAKVMLDSHVFVYPGAVGLSLIHAFNYGLPAIVHSSDKNHMPEFSAFEDGINGLSFEMNNVDSLAEIIKKLTSLDCKSYDELCHGAYSTVEKSFNVDDMVNRFDGMIKDIYSKHDRSKMFN